MIIIERRFLAIGIQLLKGVFRVPPIPEVSAGKVLSWCDENKILSCVGTRTTLLDSKPSLTILVLTRITPLN